MQSLKIINGLGKITLWSAITISKNIKKSVETLTKYKSILSGIIKIESLLSDV